MAIAKIILILVGLFTIAGGVFDWEWVMGHWKSRLFVKMCGRNGARVLYVVFGLGVAGLGIFISIISDGS